MTEKELHKLKREDLLKLLLAEVREADEIGRELEELKAQYAQLSESYERLRKRLDQKDVTIHRLRDILEAERHQRHIELREAGSIAEAALRLNGVFAAAQAAADQYVYNIKQLQDKETVSRRRERMRNRLASKRAMAARRGKLKVLAGKAAGRARNRKNC